MQTVAWLFLVIAVVIFRQVSKGRVENLADDLRDFFLALVSGDNAAMKEIAARTGEGLSAVAVDTASVPGAATAGGTVGGTGDVGAAGSSHGAALLSEARKLGSAAGNRYVWGATGPSSYDCSGLVWRAARNIGVYKGGRFTTHTFRQAAKGWAVEVSKPAVGDVVLWGGHMGIVSGNDRMYSALSRNSGIKESGIKSHSGTPSYWRLK